MKGISTKNFVVIAIAAIVGVVISIIPPFPGVTPEGMRYIGIFLGMIIVLIFDALPSWAACLLGMGLMALTSVAPVTQVFASFSSSLVWLLIGVFAMTIGIQNSGLLTRIALKLLTIFPKNYLGQVLSMMAVGLVVNPVIPSNAAKTNLIIPLTTDMTEQVGYKEHSKPALGLFSAMFMPASIGSNAFVTGSAYAIFMMGVMGMSFSFGEWFSMAAVWWVCIILGTFIWCMTYCKPKEKLDLPAGYFEGKLKDLGNMSFQEKAVAIVLIFCLVLWIGNWFDACTVSLIATVVMVMFGIIGKSDINTRMPWGLVIFIASIMSLSNLTSAETLGVSAWLANVLGPIVQPLLGNIWILVPAVLIITWVLRFFIPAQGVVLVLVFSAFAPFLADAGISPFVVCFVEYMGGFVWFTAFMAPLVMGSLAVAGNKYVTIKEASKSSWAYAVICMIGMLASIPAWQFLGLC